jgi:hypothetical protein
MSRGLGVADRRPRIHLWPCGGSAEWSIGPVGIRTWGSSYGAALDAAMAKIGHQPAVVIIEPQA